MSNEYSFEVTRSAPSSAERAFELVRDAPAWARWAGVLVPASKWADGGQTSAESVVGRTRVVIGVLKEHITGDDRPTAAGGEFVHAYRIDDNAGFRGYRAQVSLSQLDDVTALRWSGSFSASNPIVGEGLAKALGGFIGLLADALLKAARER